MKVLLILPPLYRFVGIKYKYFPLSLGHLAASLKKLSDVEVKIYNAEADDDIHTKTMSASFNEQRKLGEKLENIDDNSPMSKRIWSEINNVLNDFKPHIVAITCLSSEYIVATRIGRLVRNKLPQSITVLGGPHCSALPKESLKDEIDFILTGEGENTLAELVTMVKNGYKNKNDLKNIKGICFRDKQEKIFINEEKDYPNLDNIGSPARDVLMFKERFRPMNYAHMMVNRGCPFECTFCSVHSIHDKKVKHFKINKLIDEIKEILFEYKAEYIHFHDSIFNVSSKFVSEFCNEILKQKINFKWRINCHVNTVKEDILELMIEAGLDMALIGMEAADNQSIKKIGKNFSVDDVVKVVELFKRKGLKHIVSMIYGFPFDTEETFKKRNEFLLNLDPQHIAGNIFMPLPGSKLFNEWVQKENVDINKINWLSMTAQSLSNKYAYNIKDERYEELIVESYDVIDYINKKNQAYHDGYFSG